jgi:hypothetical protein
MNIFKEKYPLISALTTYDKNYRFDDKLIDFHSRRHEELIKSKSQRDLLFKYFGSKLHDSPILKIQQNGKESISITVNDYHCYDFASETCHYKKIKKKKRDLVFPLTIIFHKPTIKLSRINKNGKQIYVKEKNRLQKLAYWIHDEVTFLDERQLKVGLLLEASPCKGNKGELLLEISAQSVEFIEMQKDQYLNLFGSDFATYWKGFEERWSIKGFVSQDDSAFILENIK